jgi:mRNA interferase RelE/StbE
VYSVVFEPKAKNAFNKLDPSVRKQVSEALARRALNPHISSARLGQNLAGRYKIKLKKLGLRVIYNVVDEQLMILVIAVGKRENNEVYNLYEDD